MFDLTALYCLVKNNAGKYAAALSSVIFISFACVSNQHSLLVSYTIGHQIPSGLVLFSLNEFIKYYSRDRKTRRLIISGVLLVSASVLYEACTVYYLLFFAYAFYRANEKNLFEKTKKAVIQTAPHIVLLALYIAVYILWRQFYPSDYSGSVISFSSISQSLITMLKYSFGMIPGLPAAAMYIKKYISADELKNCLHIWMAAAPILTGVMFYRFIPEIRKCSLKKSSAFFCTAGIFIPNIIICFTPKYTEWAAGNSYSYVTSFYSYFFIVLLFTAFAKLIMKNDSKAVRTGLSVLVFCISLLCTVNNSAWNCYFGKNLDRYSAFMNAVSDDYFDSLEDGTFVYIPDYTGIHNDMSITEDFVSVYTDTELHFTNNADEIDFSFPAVIIKYDAESKTAELGRLYDDLTFDTDKKIPS